MQKMFLKTSSELDITKRDEKLKLMYSRAGPTTRGLTRKFIDINTSQNNWGGGG
jgi:hypothetical protein